MTAGAAPHGADPHRAPRRQRRLDNPPQLDANARFSSPPHENCHIPTAPPAIPTPSTRTPPPTTPLTQQLHPCRRPDPVVRRPGRAQATGLIRRVHHRGGPPGHKLFTEREVLRRWWPWDDGADPDSGPGGGGRPGSRLPSVRVHPGDRAGPGRAGRQRPRRGVRRGRGPGRGGQRIPPPAGTGRAPAGQDRAGHHEDHPPQAVGVLRHRRQRARDARGPGRVRAAPDPGIGGHRDVRRLPARACRSGRPAIRLPVHQLHQLRAAVHHRPGCALRPAADDHGGVRDVRTVRGRIP